MKSDSHSRLNWKSVKTFFECSAGPKNFVVANRRTSLLEHLSCLFLLMALCLFIAFVAWFVIVFLKRKPAVPSGDTETTKLLESIISFETEHDYARWVAFGFGGFTDRFCAHCNGQSAGLGLLIGCDIESSLLL